MIGSTTQRRAKERIELVRQLEQSTRAVVETEQLLARHRAEQTALRARLLAAVGLHKRPIVPTTTLDAARAVESGANTAEAVGEALGITRNCARTRLQRAMRANLIERTERGRYRSFGAPKADGEEEATPTQ